MLRLSVLRLKDNVNGARGAGLVANRDYPAPNVGGLPGHRRSHDHPGRGEALALAKKEPVAAQIRNGPRW